MDTYYKKMLQSNGITIRDDNTTDAPSNESVHFKYMVQFIANAYERIVDVKRPCPFKDVKRINKKPVCINFEQLMLLLAGMEHESEVETARFSDCEIDYSAITHIHLKDKSVANAFKDEDVFTEHKYSAAVNNEYHDDSYIKYLCQTKAKLWSDKDFLKLMSSVLGHNNGYKFLLTLQHIKNVNTDPNTHYITDDYFLIVGALYRPQLFIRYCRARIKYMKSKLLNLGNNKHDRYNENDYISDFIKLLEQVYDWLVLVYGDVEDKKKNPVMTRIIESFDESAVWPKFSSAAAISPMLKANTSAFFYDKLKNNHNTSLSASNLKVFLKYILEEINKDYIKNTPSINTCATKIARFIKNCNKLKGTNGTL